MKNLENYGVQEMNAQEMVNVDGGKIPYMSGWGWNSVTWNSGAVVYNGIEATVMQVGGFMAGLIEGIEEGLND